MVFHFISPQFQIGIRGFVGLSKANQLSAPSIEIFTKSDTEHQYPSANYITWSAAKDSQTTIQSRAKQPDKDTVTVPVADEDAGIAWIQGYPDSAINQASWFVVPLDGCPDGPDETNIIHFVAIERDSIGKWDPNKYILDHDALSKSLQFSRTVLATVEKTDKVILDTLMPILRRVAESKCASDAGTSCIGKSNEQALNKIKELIQNDQLSTSVVLFSASQQRAQSATRVLIFKFS